MDLLKGLQKTALLSSACAVLALMAMPASAADTVSDVAHVSASVGSLLSIVETTPVKFGNIVVTTTNAVTPGDGTVVMTPAGVRTTPNTGTDQITLLKGTTNTVPGGDDAGSESPGFYAVSGATANAHIFITFAKTGSANALIDTNHPTNQVTLSCAACTGSKNFYADTFKFNKTGTDAIYGDYIAVDGTGAATVQVGATLHTDPTETGVAATDYPDGAYVGTFDIMASY